MRGMYTNAIIEAIAKKPGIRAVEIADQVDCEVEAVERSISEEIQAGRIRREIIAAPNGKPTCAFWPKENAVPAMQEPPMGKPEVVSVVLAAVKSVSSPQRQAPATGRSKVELAMDFIRSKPTQEATDAEMREVMSLRKDQFPSTFLSTQRANGEIHKDGATWKLGPRVEAPEATRTNIRKVLAGEFRCAVWSDGELHLARGEQTVMQLSPAETQKLRMFLANAIVAP